MIPLEQRYSCIDEGPFPEENVLLLGKGCFWKKCTFCDYYEDASSDAISIPLNNRVLSRVTGKHHRLVVLNSGSFFELPQETQSAILTLCLQKKIDHLHIESHWQARAHVLAFKKRTDALGIHLHPRIGIETFDEPFREEYLKKGMGYGVKPEDIAQIFDECCLLFGLPGQTPQSLKHDLALAEAHFTRTFVNLFNDNSTAIKADQQCIQWFIDECYPTLSQNPKFQILLHNTDLGVGN